MSRSTAERCPWKIGEPICRSHAWLIFAYSFEHLAARRAQQMSPMLDHYTGSWHSQVNRVKTVAEVKAAGLDGNPTRLAAAKGVAGSVLEAAGQEAVSEARVKAAMTSHKMALQIVKDLNASLELPDVIGRQIEECVMEMVPDLTEKVADVVSETADDLTDKIGVDLGIGNARVQIVGEFQSCMVSKLPGVAARRLGWAGLWGARSQLVSQVHARGISLHRAASQLSSVITFLRNHY